MATSEDEGSDRAPKNIIYEMRRRVQATRNRYFEEGVDGPISSETHRQLAAKAVEYYDVLYEYRDERIVDDDDWPDISPIRSRIGRKTTQTISAAGRCRSTSTIEVPAVTEVPAEQIIDITKELDDLAKKLGFSAAAKQATPEDEAKPEHLIGLLDERSQSEAKSQLPKRFLNSAEDDEDADETDGDSDE